MKEQIVPSFAEQVETIWKNLQARYTKEGTFSVASPLSSTPLPIYQWIIENAALLMSISSIIVATNAVLLNRSEKDLITI